MCTNQEADLLVTGVRPTSSRLKIVDMTSPFALECIAFLFSVNAEIPNVNAVIKPFQWPVSSDRKTL